VKKISAVAMRGKEIFWGLKLTVGLDLGDRASHYCILDEAGALDVLRACALRRRNPPNKE
jgi:hypothetical protein